MFYVYVIKSKKDKSLYIGLTRDLRKRFSEHNQGLSRHTKARIPFGLVYYEAYASEKDARIREKKFKKFKDIADKSSLKLQNFINSIYKTKNSIN